MKNGSISVITSNHHPLDKESKELEFPYADFGVIGLETTFSLLNTHIVGDAVSLEELIQILTVNPRNVLNLPVPQVKEGAPANLTIFDPELSWIFEENDIGSKSKNTPFIGKEFKGKVLGIVNNGIIRRN